ncbi:MAG: RluA family pseudouridine synthase [Muribaculaceae bacterium]|nr:RluA family pseudouridine synthase [Muribaculaceae bacterium]
MKRLRNTKPGAERSTLRTDVVRTFNVKTEAPLMAFLMESMPDQKRTTVKELLAHDQVAVDGVPVRQFDHTLTPDTEVKVNFTRPWHIFRHRRIQLVYEDDDILVINKGYGLLSMGNDKVNEGTAYSIMRDYVKWSDPRNKIFIVHRLDRDTSGLMIYAKNEKAKEALQHNWNNMVLSRTYVAVVEGDVEQPEGTIQSYLAENSQYEVYSTDNPSEGKLAVTRYHTLKHTPQFSLLEVELDTGRKNQIRVHMKDLGHPISGDRKYGASASPIHRLALHARTLRFVHPITRREMNFTTPIPQSFSRLVRR